jgi:small subunit ribosomal protein S20
MPLLPHAKKALRASKRKADQNNVVRSAARTAIKRLRTNPLKEHLPAAYKAIDKAVKKGIFHQNKAARLKSQLAKLVK